MSPERPGTSRRTGASCEDADRGAVEERRDRLHRGCVHGLERELAQVAEVRQEHRVLQRQQRMAGWQRLLIEDVQSCGCDRSACERFDERWLVDNRTLEELTSTAVDFI